MENVPENIRKAIASLERTKEEARKRRPRFKRTPTKPFRFIEKKHGPILKMLYHYGRARTSDIIDITGLSRKMVGEELPEMYHDGGLITRRKISNTDEIMAGLTNAGAKKLHELYGYEITSTDYTQAIRLETEGSFKHKLGVAAYSAAVHRGANKLDHIDFADKPEIYSTGFIPAAVWDRRREAKIKREYWKATLPKGAVKKVQSEADWMHRFLGCTSDPSIPQFHFPEYDRGGEPNFTKNLKRTSIYRKMLCYTGAFYQNFHQEYWGIQSFRIPWIIDTGYHGRERLSNFLEVNYAVTSGKGSRLFVFIPSEALASDNILTDTFLNGKGEEVRLID